MRSFPPASCVALVVSLLSVVALWGCDDVTGTLVKSAIADPPTEGGSSAGGEEWLDPFPPQERSEEILAMEAILDATLALPTYCSGETPFDEFLIEWAQEGLSWSYYHLQIPLDGLVSMYEATGRQDYFELALGICETMVASANQDRDGDGHPEWDGTRDGEAPSSGDPDVLLYDFQGSVAIIRLARVIITTPRLTQTYGGRGQALASFVENHIIDKWLYTRNRLDNYFRIQLLEQDRWNDKCSMLVRMLADLYAITGEPARLQLAVEFTQGFKDGNLLYDAGDDCYTFGDIPAMDTAHTNREATFINRCAEDNIVFTDQDAFRVGNTLVNRIWNGSLEDPACTNFHTGDNWPMQNRGPWEWGLVYDGWIRSGRVNPAAQEVGAALLAATQVWPPPNPTVERSRDSTAVTAFCGHLARNLWLNGQ